MGRERVNSELEVFHLFTVAAGLSTPHTLAEKRKQPEPDILFQDASGTFTAFELVELIDEKYAGSLGLQIETKAALYTHYEALPELERSLFDKKYGNALLYFRFIPSLTFKRRLAAFKKIFAQLLILPNDFTGDAFESDTALQDAINGVSIERGRFVGPIFDPESVGYVCDPTVLAISKKFMKVYETIHPIELLAHIEKNPMFPNEVWISNLEKFLAIQSRPLPFRRIWVFHAGRNKVEFIYPNDL